MERAGEKKTGVSDVSRERKTLARVREEKGGSFPREASRALDLERFVSRIGAFPERISLV